MIAIKYTDKYQTVSSSSMLLQDDGKVLMALDTPSNLQNDVLFTMKFAIYDSKINEMQYMKKLSNFYGHSASLTRGLGEYSTYIYLGGSSMQNTVI